LALCFRLDEHSSWGTKFPEAHFPFPIPPWISRFVRVADDSPADNSSTHKSLVPPCIPQLGKRMLWRLR